MIVVAYGAGKEKELRIWSLDLKRNSMSSEIFVFKKYLKKDLELQMSVVTTFIQPYTGNSSQASKTRKRKGTQIGKEKYTTILTGDMILYRENLTN